MDGLMTPTASNRPGLTNVHRWDGSPLSSGESVGDLTATETTMTTMLPFDFSGRTLGRARGMGPDLTNANALALLSFAMSRCNESGYETAAVKKQMTNEREKRNPKMRESATDGRSDERTWGIVSPASTSARASRPRSETAHRR